MFVYQSSVEYYAYQTVLKIIESAVISDSIAGSDNKGVDNEVGEESDQFELDSGQVRTLDLDIKDGVGLRFFIKCMISGLSSPWKNKLPL